MKGFVVFLVICLALLVASYATAGEEETVTADGGISFSTGQYVGGPRLVDVATDGDATIKFMWFLPANRDSIIRQEPVGTYGNSSYALRADYPPRGFDFEGAGPDSAYVDLDTATEVIVTW